MLVFRLVGQTTCRLDKRRIEMEWLDALALEVAEPSIYQKLFDEEDNSDESTSASTSVYEEWPPKPSPRLPRAASAPTVGVRRVAEPPPTEPPLPEPPLATPPRKPDEDPPAPSELHGLSSTDETPNPVQLVRDEMVSVENVLETEPLS